MSEPTIPFGFKRIFGQAQKGDGVWDGEPFRRAKKEYPWGQFPPPRVIIRKQEVAQTEIPGTEGPLSFD